MLVVPPGPAGSIPSRLVVLSLTQLKAVPPIELLKLIVVITAPEQIVCVAGNAVTTGTSIHYLRQSRTGGKSRAGIDITCSNRVAPNSECIRNKCSYPCSNRPRTYDDRIIIKCDNAIC